MEYTYKVIELEKGLPIRLVLHRKPSYSYHWHKELEFFLVLEGSVHVKTTKNDYVVNKNEMLMMNCNEIHASEFVGPGNVVVIIQLDMTMCKPFGYDFANIWFNREEWMAREDYAEVMRRIQKLIVSLLLEMNERRIGYQNEVMAHIHSLISFMLRNVPYTLRENVADAMSELDFLRLNKILNYINENYMEQISLKDVANEQFLNVYYLTHFFKKKVGLTFSECLNQVRLQKATELIMADSSGSMADIALLVGFPSVKSFSRSFKEKYKVTPYRYKKQQLGLDETKRSAHSPKAAVSGQIDSEVFSAPLITKLEQVMAAL